jgi:hypothetical protein
MCFANLELVSPQSHIISCLIFRPVVLGPRLVGGLVYVRPADTVHLGERVTMEKEGHRTYSTILKSSLVRTGQRTHSPTGRDSAQAPCAPQLHTPRDIFVVLFGSVPLTGLHVNAVRRCRGKRGQNSQRPNSLCRKRLPL